MRTSVIGSVEVLTVLFGGIVHLGDTRYIQANTKIFALQRQQADFEANEYPLEEFGIFRRPIPQLSPAEDVTMVKRDTVPVISVGAVRIVSVSTDAIFQAGSSVCVDLETRIKHIRQFLPQTETGYSLGSGAAQEAG
ncbi:spore germination protein GerPE [Paenibacillus chartarius]|uniref:Spore germination protein GerPE n=1 Tax=Paenibacillus chartarius TaxID=747481 RepID=A0ABV6DG41_9BACL